MKPEKNIHEKSNANQANPFNETNLLLIKFFSLPLLFAVVISISLGFVTKSVRAENNGSQEGHRGYKYIEPEGQTKKPLSTSQGTNETSAIKDTGAMPTNAGEQSKTPNEKADAATTDLSIKDPSAEKSAGAKKITSDDPNAQLDPKIEPVTKPTDGKGVYPTFAEADIDGDHYLTKYELKNYPYLLQVFDKVDAGKDGKLEQHEYQNLEMETKREGEVR